MKKLIYFLSFYFVVLIVFIVLANSISIKNDSIAFYLIGFTFIFWYITFFVYLFQIAIIIIGLLFHFIKEKQTIKNLLVPYGFIFTLKNYYKELK